MFWQALFHFIQQQVTGKKIECAQATASASLRLNETLGMSSVSAMIHLTGPWLGWKVWRFEA